LKDHKFSLDRVRFTYVYADHQTDFVASLANADAKEDQNGNKVVPDDPLLRVAIIWRNREEKVR